MSTYLVRGVALPDGSRTDLSVHDGVFTDEVPRGGRVIDGDGATSQSITAEDIRALFD